MAVDHHTKFVYAIPLRNKQSKSAIDALACRILPFIPSVPTCILSDNGSEFTSAEFCEFLGSCNIEHRLTIPYCPTSNGAVERVNRTIQNLLKTIVDEGSRWDEHLSRAVISYNHAPHTELGMSPSQFLLSKSHSMAANLPLQPELQSYWRMGNPKFMSFKVGDLVLKRNELKGNNNINKFLPRFTGPYKICKVNSKGLTYDIKECGTDGVIKAHHSKLKLFKQPPKYLSENNLYMHFKQTENVGEPGWEPILQDNVEYGLVEASSSHSVQPMNISNCTTSSSSTGSDTSYFYETTSDMMSRVQSVISSGEWTTTPANEYCELCAFELYLELELDVLPSLNGSVFHSAQVGSKEYGSNMYQLSPVANLGLDHENQDNQGDSLVNEGETDVQPIPTILTC